MAADEFIPFPVEAEGDEKNTLLNRFLAEPHDLFAESLTRRKRHLRKYFPRHMAIGAGRLGVRQVEVRGVVPQLYILCTTIFAVFTKP